MKASQLRENVIKPILNHLGELYAQANAVELLVGTALVESRLEYLKQINGPALGIYQIEPDTHDDVWDNFLYWRSDSASTIRELCAEEPTDACQLATNLAYATAIARMVYFRVPFPIPESSNIEGLAKYWKEHYNTKYGSGKVEDFISLYNQYAGE